MKILLLTYYFPPDLSAGSFRAKALADALAKFPDVDLEVITTVPNRYETHRPEWFPESNLYDVKRSRLPDNRYGLKGQVVSFVRYARSVIRIVKLQQGEYDVVVATSSRLMTGFLGSMLARKYKAPLFLDIRDIFVETIHDVFPGVVLAPVRLLFGLIERWTVAHAQRVNLVSEGFLSYFEHRYQRRDYSFYTNGVDDVFVSSSTRLPGLSRTADSDAPLHIVYAGNVGEGQGLEKILPELALRVQAYARFTIVGDGGKRQKLIERCRQYGASVAFVDAIPRESLLRIYESADVLFLHLNDFPAFRRVLPSKLFEYAALGKPILAGVSGYAKEFIEAKLDGVEVFDPCDVIGAQQALNRLEIRTYDREEFVQTYSRSRIMNCMAADIIELGVKFAG